MKRTLGLIATSAIAAITLTGCASTGAGASGQPSGNVTPFTGSASAAAGVPSSQPPPAEASSGPCVTKACIAADMDKELVGMTAADESVSVKAKCNKHTVVYHQAADDYSARCVITFSDGSQAMGTGNWLVSAGKVTFQPDGT